MVRDMEIRSPLSSLTSSCKRINKFMIQRYNPKSRNRKSTALNSVFQLSK